MVIDFDRCGVSCIHEEAVAEVSLEDDGSG